MQIDVITLFPEMFDGVKSCGISRIAIEQKELTLGCFNLRAYTADRYRSVDDRPYGGGPGMVLMPEPVANCIDAVKGQNDGPVVYLSPQGEKLDQGLVNELAELRQLVLLCGRYEGVDERVLQSRVDREISIGDYVLAGGEIPAMVMIEAIARLLPGVLGNPMSARQDSFGQSPLEGALKGSLSGLSSGMLDCAHYTRPEMFEGVSVPPVLLSGNHEKIRQWRAEQSLARTKQRRPDLLEGRQFENLK